MAYEQANGPAILRGWKSRSSLGKRFVQFGVIQPLGLTRCLWNRTLNCGDIRLQRLNSSWETDRVKVLWRKGEKHSLKESERGREILYSIRERVDWSVVGNASWVFLPSNLTKSPLSTRLETRTKESGIIANMTLWKVPCVVKTNPFIMYNLWVLLGST